MMVLALCCVTVFGMGTGAGAGAETGTPRQISVNGEASISLLPDMAVLTLGAVETSKQAGVAVQALAARNRQMMAALGRFGIGAGQMQTTGIGLQPVWSDRGAGQSPPKITGFEAQTTLRVRVEDLSTLPKLLDAVIAQGANRIDGLRFDLKDPQTPMDEVRQDAVRDAMAKAQLMAQTAGVTLGPLISLHDQGGPRFVRREMALQDAALPIAAGQIEFSASVAAVFAIE
jgi:uncharacterized protein YggE